MEDSEKCHSISMASEGSHQIINIYVDGVIYLFSIYIYIYIYLFIYLLHAYSVSGTVMYAHNKCGSCNDSVKETIRKESGHKEIHNL